MSDIINDVKGNAKARADNEIDFLCIFPAEFFRINEIHVALFLYARTRGRLVRNSHSLVNIPSFFRDYQRVTLKKSGARAVVRERW